MIDFEKLDAMKALMEDGFEAFLSVFLSELDKDTKIIQVSKDFELIALKAHSQKSSCALLGAQTLSETFAKIEQLARTEQTADEWVEKLPDLLAQVKQALA
jgi:HPt (histidine-containing phosphotransfer) domain-containing protein